MELTITSEIINHINYLKLNRPKVYNSFNGEMALCLQKHLDAAAENNDVRCIVITGTGKAFCAGQDLKEVQEQEKIDFRTILEDHYQPIITKIRQIKKPILAAVNGIAAGAGANIALACDIVVTAKSAKFNQAFSKIALIPDCGGTFFLPRLIGFQKASALMLLGDDITAVEAERIGMIFKYFDDELFDDEVKALALRLSNAPTKALGKIKTALNYSFQNTLIKQLDLENSLQIECGKTDDFKEGLLAFKEKRKPKYTGE